MKKSLALLVAILMCVALFSACNSPAPSTGEDNQTPVSSDAQSPAPDDAQTSAAPDASITAEASVAPDANLPEIIMVTNAGFPPFEYVTNNGIVGTYDGIDVALSAEIAKELGRKLRVDDMEFTAALLAISSGKADFAAAGITATDERRQNMDFSDPYYVAAQNIVVRADNTTVNSAMDLKNVKTGAVEGYTGEQVCIDKLKIQPDTYKKAVDGIIAVTQNKIDALVLDSHTAKAMVAQNPELKIIEDSTNFESEEYAIAVKKGNQELLNTINAVIKRVKADGTFDGWVEKYGQIMAESTAQ